LRQQKLLTSGLVLHATTMKLVGMQDLASVMEHDGDADEIRIVRYAQAPKLRQKQIGSLADQAHMRH
jgi:hypothetical protein